MATKKPARKPVYTEPADYFPKSIRKELKIGEYAAKNTAGKKKTVKKSK